MFTGVMAVLEDPKRLKMYLDHHVKSQFKLNCQSQLLRCFYLNLVWANSMSGESYMTFLIGAEGVSLFVTDAGCI